MASKSLDWAAKPAVECGAPAHQNFTEEQLREYKEYQAKERAAIEERVKRRAAMEQERRALQAAAADVAAKARAVGGRAATQRRLRALATFGLGVGKPAPCQPCVPQANVTPEKPPSNKHRPQFDEALAALAQRHLSVLSEACSLEGRAARLKADAAAAAAASEEVEAAALARAEAARRRGAHIERVCGPAGRISRGHVIRAACCTTVGRPRRPRAPPGRARHAPAPPPPPPARARC